MSNVQAMQNPAEALQTIMSAAGLSRLTMQENEAVRQATQIVINALGELDTMKQEAKKAKVDVNDKEQGEENAKITRNEKQA